jgi:hypothetical protein
VSQKNPIPCSVSQVTLSQQICGTSYQYQQSGEISAAFLPSFYLCYWTVDLTSFNSSSNQFTIQSSLPVFFKIDTFIGEEQFRVSEVHNISSDSTINIDLSGQLFQITVYTYSNTVDTSLNISWNKSFNDNTKAIYIAIITVSCVAVLFVLVLIILCLAKKAKNKQMSRVSAGREYESVPAESSFSSYIDSILPQKIFTGRNVNVPCCICFARYNKNRIEYGEFVRIVKCEHVFHSTCIEEWINEKKQETACPLCLKPIFEAQVNFGQISSNDN